MDELSHRQAMDQGINPALYSLSLLKELPADSYAGQLDALVWREGKPPGLQALITLDDGRKVLAVAYWKSKWGNAPEYQGFRDFQPGQRITLIIGRGPRGGLKVSLAEAGYAEFSAEGGKDGLPAYRITWLGDDDDRMAFISHQDGFSITKPDLAATYGRAIERRGKPTSVYVVDSVAADEDGMIPARHVLEDEFGRPVLDHKTLPTPGWWIRR